MLLPCPECEHKVSDRAKACPECGFPISEWIAEQRENERREAARRSREQVGEADCPTCEARGFVLFTETDHKGVERELFSWCTACKHTGRVIQCRDSEGFWAVDHAVLAAFLAGEIDAPHQGLRFLGADPLDEHRYDRAGKPWEE